MWLHQINHQLVSSSTAVKLIISKIMHVHGEEKPPWSCCAVSVFCQEVNTYIHSILSRSGDLECKRIPEYKHWTGYVGSQPGLCMPSVYHSRQCTYWHLDFCKKTLSYYCMIIDICSQLGRVINVRHEFISGLSYLVQIYYYKRVAIACSDSQAQTSQFISQYSQT